MHVARLPLTLFIGKMMSAFTLDDRYLLEDGEVYLTGVQALVRVVLDRLRDDRRAGHQTAAFISGYEGSPLGGLDLEVARRAALFQPYQLVHQPGLNEELAATSVMGSQLAARLGLRCDGVTGFWYGKAPGLDRATDALRHANMAGAHPRGGAVALVGDDPNAKSSTVPSASEAALADLAIPVLFPADPADIVDFGRHAVQLSRAQRPVDGAEGGRQRRRRRGHGHRPPGLGGTGPDGAGQPGAPTGMSRAPGCWARTSSGWRRACTGCGCRWRPATSGRAASTGSARGPRDRVGIVTAGKSYLDVRQALRALGLAGG